MRANIIFDDNSYIKSYNVNDLGEYELPEGFELYYMHCYHLVDNEIVLDEEKKAEQIAEEERQSKLPTWQETIDAQVTYTAMMTDTMLEE